MTLSVQSNTLATGTAHPLRRNALTHSIGRERIPVPQDKLVRLAGTHHETQSDAKPRTVFILHSGMNDPGCTTSTDIKAALTKRGIPEADIITLPSPYPHFWEQENMTPEEMNDDIEREFGPNGLQLVAQTLDAASECGPICKTRNRYSQAGINIMKNVVIYMMSSNPRTDLVRAAYYFYAQAMAEHNVPRDANIVWIGHSAGGQMGLTLAGLSNADPAGVPIKKVITMGSPIMTNHAPKPVEVTHYLSPQDKVFSNTTGWSILTGFLVRARELAPNLDGNDAIRDYDRVGHEDYWKYDDLMDQVLSDAFADRSDWDKRPPKFWQIRMHRVLRRMLPFLAAQTIKPA